MPSALRLAPQLSLATGFAALNVWLALASARGERIAWQGLWETALFFALWGAAGVLVGALLPRAAHWIPLPAIAATAAVAEALPGFGGGSRLLDWAVQLVVMQALVLAGAVAVRRRRDSSAIPPVPRALVVTALVLGLAVPAAVGLAWQARTAPPQVDVCESPPPGQQAKVAVYRRGLAPALAVAIVLLLAPALALSRALRGRRPGAVTLSAGVLAAAWAGAALLNDGVLEWAPSFGLLLVLVFTVTVPALAGAVVWVARRPRAHRAPAMALVATLLSLTVTIGGVGGSLVAAGDSAGSLCPS